jgi:glycosyltransferase involved in cell wall biosynthesis
MRVLLVIDDLGSGGAQRQLIGVAVGLAARGHRVGCFTYYPDAHFAPDLAAVGVTRHEHRKSGRFAVAPVLALRRTISQGRYEAVIAFQETPAVYAELAAGLRGGVRLIVVESNIVYGGHATTGRILKSHLHRLADVVVSNSHTHHEWLAQRFPFLRDRLRTVWNGVDLRTFRPAHRRPARTWVQLLGIGRLAPQKNVPALAEALAKVRATGADVRVDWVGRVDDESEAERAYAAVERFQLGEAWRWLGQRDDVPALLRDCDALILPSLWEGLPNVVCEALASGVPVLASRASDNAQLVPDGVNGFNFAAEDVNAIADSILRFVALHEGERDAMRHRAREFAERELSFPTYVDRYERVLGV